MISRFSAACFVAGVIACIFSLSCSDRQSGPSGNFTRVVRDTSPSFKPLSPEESMKLMQLPPGFSVELVAAEPMVQEPVGMAWDGNGRLYVVEMNTYMKDAAATGEYEPLSRIKRLEDTNGD